MPIGIRSIASKNSTFSVASETPYATIAFQVAASRPRADGRAIASSASAPRPNRRAETPVGPSRSNRSCATAADGWMTTLQPTIMTAPTTARFIAMPASGDTLQAVGER